ncbi:hypothetical protein Tco_0845902, partial [Tanacetum coccineum]
IILEDIYNTFYIDEAELAKEGYEIWRPSSSGGPVRWHLSHSPKDGPDKGKGKMDDLVDAVEKGKSKLMVSEKGTKKASVELVDALDLQNRIKKLYEDFNTLVKAKKIKEAKEAEVVKAEVSSNKDDSSDEVFFGDEDLVLFNHVKYPLSDAEIRMFKERPTTFTSTRSKAPTASTRFRALITSTSNAQPATPRGYRKIAMTGCVLGLRALNDPNAPPPSTTRKRKP